MMKKYPILLATSLLISSVFAQETVNYKKEMMKLEGEKNRPILSEFTNSITDYSTFQRTYAWNTRIPQQSIFGNTKELDIPIIGGRVRSTLVDKTTNINLAYC